MALNKTKADEVYMGLVADLGCVVCRNADLGETPAQVHHIRTGVGGGQRAGHTLVLPLCEYHHTGQGGIHKARASFERQHGSELTLLDQTIREVIGGLRAAGVLR